jgi:integrase
VLMKFTKDSLRYWENQIFKNKYKYKGKVRNSGTYCSKIMHEGKRVTFNLKTGNKAQAAVLAKEIYLHLQLNGYEETVKKYKSNGEKKNESPTVGAFLKEIRDKANLRAETLYTYEKKFRRLVAEACGVKISGPRVGSGNQAIKEKVHEVKLSDLTPTKVAAWKKKFISGAVDQEEKLRKINTVNSIIRNSRSLFTAKNLIFVASEFNGSASMKDQATTRKLKGNLVIPHDPFEDIILDTLPIRKYDSEKQGINLAKIFKAARDELKEQLPELYKVFLLSSCAGLRRSEIDWLRWENIDFEQSKLSIQVSEEYQLKTNTSAGYVNIDGHLVKELKTLKDHSKNKFVVMTNDIRVVSRKPGSYRCGYLFKQLCTWLRGQGVKAQKPIHSLRQEAISRINEVYGIHAASSFARHSDIRITSQVYVENRKKTVIDTSEFLSDSEDEDSIKDGTNN